MAVADVEGFEFLAVVAEIQPAVGQHAVHIEDRQPDQGRLAQYLAHQFSRRPKSEHAGPQ
ncbi:MAG TPA: hypothetical protein DCQ84_01000 [Candidatus Competibacteraceae bacterium]|nr:hypothetical protein [Candidatus Competibacteraceae bacterium]